MTDGRRHWDDVYGAKTDDELSWFQARPEVSLRLIRDMTASDRKAPIIDIGAGTSCLVDSLLAVGYRDLTALDISKTAIERHRGRLGAAGNGVDWIVADVTRWRPSRRWDVWHDRAVLHFLTNAADQDAYIAALSSALRPGGTAIIATFALDGPEKCSGLPVQRYSGATLAARLGPGFRLVSETPEEHVTPRGAVQAFMYACLRRV
jgi:2-polyprenyl-3-methyl-5-hydroxy-6-metoxy-1,4-benzoquinol methylase